MRKKVLLLTTIGLVLLGAVIAAALNAVFTVTDIKVYYSAFSATGIEESHMLQARLEEKFGGKSTTFLDLEDVKAAVAEFPSYHIEEVKKDFPRTIVVTVTERREAISFVRENGLYAVLDEEGLYLYDKEDNANRRAGENILLQGFDLATSLTGKLPEGRYFESVLTYATVFLQELTDARTNVLSISLMGTENEIAGSHYLRVFMREGVVIDIYGFENFAKEKAESALEKYLALDDAQRLYGFFDIVDRIDGGFTVSEHRADTPIGI